MASTNLKLPIVFGIDDILRDAEELDNRSIYTISSSNTSKSTGSGQSDRLSKFRWTKRFKPNHQDILRKIKDLDSGVHTDTLSCLDPEINQTYLKSNSHAQLTSSDLRPPVLPYAYCVSNGPLQREKSVAGNTCCFCEEILEHTLAGERVVILECRHTCHYECLLELIFSLDDPGNNLNNDEVKALPSCSTCDIKAKPLDDSIYREIIGVMLMRNRFANYSKINYQDEGCTITPPAISLCSSQRNSNSTLSSPQTLLSPRSMSGTTSESETDASVYENIHYHPSERNSWDPPSMLSYRRSQNSSDSVHNILEGHEFRVLLNFQDLSNIGDSEMQYRKEYAVRLSRRIPDNKQLDFKQFGSLRLCDTLNVCRDGQHWQDVICFLFETMLIFIRDEVKEGTRKYYEYHQLKGSVAIKKHLASVTFQPDLECNILKLDLLTAELPCLFFRSSTASKLEKWHAALIDSWIAPPLDTGLASTCL